MRLLPDNTYLADRALRATLQAALSEELMRLAGPQLEEIGRAAAHELQEWGDQCERQPAFLRPVDPWGERVDEVIYPDAWRSIGAYAARAGLTALPYEPDTTLLKAGPAARVLQTALLYLFHPSTATYSCPIAMTDGAARVLADFGPGELRSSVLPHLIARDPAQAWTAGQWMTERQGGSDVGANTVEARHENDGWRLYGLKYFCSNPTGEIALVLARPQGRAPGTRGLGLFLVPRILPDGTRNRLRIERLKEKLGTRAMATAEIRLESAFAHLVGEIDRGFAQMTSMLTITRLHNAIASAATMRRAVMLASAYAVKRTAFGRRLDQHPLQRQVLCQMAVHAEANLVLTMRIAELLGCVERRQARPEDEMLLRLGSSLAKAYTGRWAVAIASEAVEAFGGAGYMEDTGIPRLLRDAQVLPIWEGTTNVLSLDAWRVLQRPGSIEALDHELARLEAPGRIQLLDELKAAMRDQGVAEAGARWWQERITEAWIGGLLQARARIGVAERAVAERWQGRAAAPAGDARDLEQILAS